MGTVKRAVPGPLMDPTPASEADMIAKNSEPVPAFYEGGNNIGWTVVETK